MTVIYAPEELILKVKIGRVSAHDALLIINRLEKKHPDEAERWKKIREEIGKNRDKAAARLGVSSMGRGICVIGMCPEKLPGLVKGGALTALQAIELLDGMENADAKFLGIAGEKADSSVLAGIRDRNKNVRGFLEDAAAEENARAVLKADRRKRIERRNPDPTHMRRLRV
ncbi:MAG: hypothetical protein PHQ80_02300 [Candidatus ainarchaeum sp.]|nr:hypothetical protein [Candidatus ainarchaeum sp.]